MSEQIIYLSSDKIFSTIEGEGKNIGKPAIFMRLSLCNLTCSGWASPENPNGCDSTVAWKVKNKFTFEELFKLFEDKEFVPFLQRGDIFKLTGGEALIQEKNLFEWCQCAQERWKTSLNIEFETNATLIPKCKWLNDYHSPYEVDTLRPSFICSPKLSNNGDPEKKRYVVEALEWHTQNKSSTFKFVICNEKDLDELFTKYVDKFKIDRRQIWLMPECATTKQFKEKAPWVAELCKKHGFNFSPRLQILIYEQALGK
jgi:organic radical activating enzyme